MFRQDASHNIAVKRNWEPLFSRADSLPYLNKLFEIAEIFVKTQFLPGPGLLGGTSGIALFLYYMSEASGNRRYAKHGFRYLMETFERMNREIITHSLADGYTGILWCLYHLKSHGFVNQDEICGLEELDEFLVKMTHKLIDISNFDYLHGAGGVVLYLTLKEDLSLDATKLLKKYIKGLSDYYSAKIVLAKGIIDLGLAHGIPGQVRILNRILTIESLKSDAGKALCMLTEYLKTHRYPRPVNGSWYASKLEDGSCGKPSRLAWCYGDLGIGYSLWRYGHENNISDVAETGLNLLKSTVKRRHILSSRINDASFCHGAAGVAHFYLRIYQFTGNEAFKKAAKYWSQVILQMASNPNDYAGYSYFFPDSIPSVSNQTGLLEGISGIGLVILSFVFPVCPDWDEILLLK